ncbi:MAG: hypothetical protein ABI472_16140 [Ginsengibacter sp.]
MKKLVPVLVLALFFTACKKGQEPPKSKDINKAPHAFVDRFSSTAGHLFVRAGDNGLPGANKPIDMDMVPFITNGLTASGMHTTYYNFDVQSMHPDDIYVFFKKSNPTVEITEQHHVIPSLPGEGDYSDFWRVNKVLVPDYYVPNTLTSEAEIKASGLQIEKTNIIVNCPVVPFGSTASLKFGGGSQQLVICWYNDKAAAYFNFDEAPLTADAMGDVPLADIFVQFNDNAAGPSSGFKAEPATTQTHNVIDSSPGDADYSPLWQVHVIDNADFWSVKDLMTAMNATILNPNAALVNCPVVK